MTKKEIKGRECVLAQYMKANDGSNDDILLVKENIHYTDGTIESGQRILENYERDFYVTIPRYRNHTQKKEWEDRNKVKKFKSTQAKMAERIGKVLKRPPGQRLDQLTSSPYLYGADITTTSIIKYGYQDRWPDCVSPRSVAVLDFETDMLGDDHEVIITGALTFKSRVAVAYTKDFMRGVKSPDDKIRRQFNKHLEKYKKERHITLDVVECDTPGEVVKYLIGKAHEWSPDFVTAWNIAFDMKVMLKALKAEDIDPATVFSHPKLPDKYKGFKWKEQQAIKETASGQKSNKHPAELWHYATTHPACFNFIDAMCTFCILRIAAGKRSSYKLDDILDEEVNLTKLKFKVAEMYASGSADWHKEMQSRYKIEYMIYNIFDCISVEILDEKTNDLSKKLPALIGISPISKFASNPRRLANDLHFYCLNNGKVIGTTGREMTHVDDKHLLSMRGWIVTLPAHLRAAETGLRIIKDNPNLCTDIYAHVSDLDVSSGYPSEGIALNISKETTYREVCKMKGKSEATQRIIGLNMTAAATNAVEICNDALDLPKLDVLLAHYRQENRLDD